MQNSDPSERIEFLVKTFVINVKKPLDTHAAGVLKREPVLEHLRELAELSSKGFVRDLDFSEDLVLSAANALHCALLDILKSSEGVKQQPGGSTQPPPGQPPLGITGIFTCGVLCAPSLCNLLTVLAHAAKPATLTDT